MATARRTAVFGASFALASAGLLGTAVAGTHGPATHLKTTTLTIHAPSSATGKTTVTGKLRSHHAALANETVSLQHRTGKGQAWTDAANNQTTDANGKVTYTFTQGATREQYRLVFAGDTTYRKSHSGVITITRTHPAPTTSPSPTPSS